MSEMLQLFFFSNISPHRAELLGFVSCVYIIENCKLRAEEVGEVTDFNVSKVEADEVLVMPDHSSEPLVVGPSAEPGDGVDGTDVQEEP